MAVSTRNPMHLLAATNDYRTVYLPFSEGALPGIELAAQAQDSGDAWMGIFKSFNGVHLDFSSLAGLVLTEPSMEEVAFLLLVILIIIPKQSERRTQ
jgi:hypothetical protein